MLFGRRRCRWVVLGGREVGRGRGSVGRALRWGSRGSGESDDKGSQIQSGLSRFSQKEIE